MGTRPSVSNVAPYRGVGGRSSFEEPTPLRNPLPTPFVSPSSIWFPLHSRPRLGGRTGGGSERPALRLWAPRKCRRVGGRRREASWLARSKIPPSPKPRPRPPFCTSEWPGAAWSGWPGPGLVLHSGLARGPFGR